MDIHTARDGEPTGIWQLHELQAALDSGKVLPTDLIWAEGYADWQPLHAVAEEIDITLPYGEEDVPPIPSAELQSSKPIQTSPRHAVVAASVTSTNRGFPWLRLGIGVIGLSILVAIALPAYRNYRERASIEGLSTQSNGQNAVVSSARTDAAPFPNDAKPESNVAGVAAFPDRSTCEDKDNAEFGEPNSRCNKLLQEKYGAHIRFNALSKHRDADGNEWKSSDEYLVIRSDNGAAKSYEYNDSDSGHSIVPDPWMVFEPLNLLLVRVGEYGEEQSVDLIDLKSGIVSPLGDIDTPVFSPDGQRFLVNEQEYGAAYPIATSVYKVVSGKAIKEIGLGASEEDRDWWPIGARWTSNSSFEFIKGGEANTTWDEASRKPKSNGPRQVYALEAGKWQQQAAELQASSKRASAARDQIKSQNDEIPAQNSGDSINMNCLVRTETLKRWESGDMSGSAAAPAMIRVLRKAQKDACSGDVSSTKQATENILAGKNGDYAVSFGSYASAADAEKVIAALHAASLPAYREVVQLNGREAQRVRIGPFSDRVLAESARLRAEQVNDAAGAKVVTLNAGSSRSASISTASALDQMPASISVPERNNARESGFIVQVGAFTYADQATSLRDRLRGAGFSAFIDTVDTNDGMRTRVRVGPVVSRADANALNAGIKTKIGIEGAIRPYP